MKRTIKILAAVLILIIVALGVLWWRLDAVAASAVERGGSYALQVETAVESVHLSLLGGSATVNGLRVSNPEGFDAEHFLQAGRIHTEVRTRTLLSDVVVVPLIELNDLEVMIEQREGKSNAKVILENVQGSAEKPEERPGDKKYKVEKLVIDGIKGEVQVLPIGGSLSTIPIDITEPIVLENVTPDNAQGLAMSELMQRLPSIIFTAVAAKVQGLPQDLAQVLSVDALEVAKNIGADVGKIVEGLGSLGEDAVKQFSEVLGGAGELGEGLGTVLEGVGEGAGEGLKGLGEGLGNLLGGDKPQEQEQNQGN